MENTKIEWADHTFNPWEGCTKVSPGCANCYAETLAARFPTFGKWGKGAPRKRHTSADKLIRKLNRAAGVDELSAKHILRDDKASERSIAWAKAYRRPRVFVNSLSDWLDPEVPMEWLADLLTAIHAAPHLDFLLLTKRPHLWRERMGKVSGYSCLTGCEAHGIAGWLANRWQHGHAPENCWVGTSVEDQIRADERIPHLLEIPARVRFLSCEPLLSSIDLSKYIGYTHAGWSNCELRQPTQTQSGQSPIALVIIGGESGPGARPMHPDWARSLRDQCRAAGVAFFFKQWGEWQPLQSVDGVQILPFGSYALPTRDSKGFGFLKVGKRQAGRLLDGREWSQFPEVTL